MIQTASKTTMEDIILDKYVIRYVDSVQLTRVLEDIVHFRIKRNELLNVASLHCEKLIKKGIYLSNRLSGQEDCKLWATRHDNGPQYALGARYSYTTPQVKESVDHPGLSLGAVAAIQETIWKKWGRRVHAFKIRKRYDFAHPTKTPVIDEELEKDEIPMHERGKLRKPNDLIGIFNWHVESDFSVKMERSYTEANRFSIEVQMFQKSNVTKDKGKYQVRFTKDMAKELISMLDDHYFIRPRTSVKKVKSLGNIVVHFTQHELMDLRNNPRDRHEMCEKLVAYLMQVLMNLQ